MKSLRTVYALYETRSAWLSRGHTIPTTPDYARFLEDESGIRAVLEEVRSTGIDVVEFGITPATLSRCLAKIRSRNDCIAWNLTDGHKHYIGSHARAMQELWNIPSIGSDTYTQMMCQHKHHTKLVAQSYGIPVASGFCTSKDSLNQDLRSSNLHPPFFVKAANFDNSIGDTICRPICYSKSDATVSAQKLFTAGISEVLIEEYLPGTEYSVVAINTGKWVLKCMRVQYSRDQYFSSAAKDSGSFMCSINTGGTSNEMIVFTKKLLNALNLKDYCRLDFRRNQQGHIKFLEINPSPFIGSFAYAPLAKFLNCSRGRLFRLMAESSFRRQSAKPYEL